MRATFVVSLVSAVALLAYAFSAQGSPPISANQAPRTITALVGAGQDTLQVFAFFPRDLRIRAGDTVTWKINADELHTVGFTTGTQADPRAGGIQDALEAGGVTIPGFYAAASGGVPNLAAPESLIINPQMAFPTRQPGAPIERYSGNGFLNSGILAKQPPLPEIPDNQTFSVTFDTPGTFLYKCIVHPDRMIGTVQVVAPDATDVPDQAQIDARAQAEMAPLVALAAQAKAQGEQFRRSEAGPGGTTLWFVRAGNSEILTGDPRIQVFDFMPKDITVKANDTIVWASNYFHSVTFNPTPPPPDFLQLVPQPEGPPMVRVNPLLSLPARPSPTFDPTKYYNSADLGPFSPGGFSWGLTFDQPGTFEYLCVVHQEFGMKGTVTVVRG